MSRLTSEEADILSADQENRVQGSGDGVPHSELSVLCPSSGVLNNWRTAFEKLDLFAFSGEGRETPTVLCLLELTGAGQ
jgi:hypothetical protein